MSAGKRPGLEGRAAIVTGAAGGIGSAIAIELIESGCRVAAVDINGLALATLVDRAPDRVIAITGDATKADTARRTVDRIERVWGPVAILINNVGGRVGGPTLDSPMAEWQATYELSLFSHVLWMQAATPAMIVGNRGRIVNIASNAGCYRSNTGSSGLSYSSAKGAVLQLTRSAAHELGRYGITVNAIAPGSVLTEAGQQESRDLDPALHERVLRETMLGYFAPPEEIASVATFLASDDASYVTGATILANGGWCTS